MAQRLALGHAADAARLRRRTGRVGPDMVADDIALLVAARRAHVVPVEGMRLARRAVRLLRRLKLQTAGAVKHIVDDVIIGMRAFVLRHARQFFLPALVIVVRQQLKRMLADIAAGCALAVFPSVILKLGLLMIKLLNAVTADRAGHRLIVRNLLVMLCVVPLLIARLAGGARLLIVVARTRRAALAACAVVPAVGQRPALGHVAHAARPRRCAGRVLPAVAQCAALRLAAHLARLRLRARRSLPLMTAGIAAHRAHAVAPAMRLAAPRLLRQRARHARDKHRRRQQGE